MKGLRSKIEIIVIGVFVLMFLIWAVSKCGSSKEKLQQEAIEAAREDSLAKASQQPVPTTTTANPPLPVLQPTSTNPSAVQPSKTPAAGAQSAATTPKEPQYTRLYVTIDKLKIRKQPGLKGDVLGELKLFDEVYFMDEETDSTYTVNLGKEIADEPYVKIKTKKGTVGWVYGAGVHYARKKRSGVLE